MDGILLINKPKGVTSRDVVNTVSKILETKKIGHTGTLDPMAEGVLVLCVGKATKLVELLTNHDKIYEAKGLFGILTDTLDSTGKVLSKNIANISSDELLKVFETFPKKYLQEVPIYSAVKVNGKKLYEYARNNEKIELPKKEVSIYSLELKEVSQIDENTSFTFKTHVSRGTYIRSLINDIASYLNTNAIMTDLKRLKQGNFTIDMCYSIEDIENGNFNFISVEEVLKDYPTYEVDDELYFRVKNGQILDNIYKEDLIVFTKDKKVISIYKEYTENKIKPYQMFI